MSTPTAAQDAPVVLVVEDDTVLGSHLRSALQAHGYAARWASTAAEALAAAATEIPALVLLDLGLPDADGVDLARDLRLAHPDAVIVVLTARTAELDVIAGLDAGADDYLTKPFRLNEVLARVRAHLRRRPAANVAPRRPTGSLAVDPTARRVTFAGTEIRLRPKEHEVLALLAARVGEAVSRADLMAGVWDENWFGSTKTLDVTVASLRQHLVEAGVTGPDAPILVTLRGFGYRLDPPFPDVDVR